MPFDVSQPITRREFVIDYISPLVCEELSGQSGDAEISVLPFDELLYPSGLLVEGTGPYTLSWNAVSRAICYNVYRATDIVGPYQLIAACISSRTYDDNPGTGVFYYRVSAITPDGPTPLSPPVPTPEEPPVPPVTCTIEETELNPLLGFSNGGFAVGAIDTFAVAGLHQFCSGNGTIYLGTLGGSVGSAYAVNASGASAGRADNSSPANDGAYWDRVSLGTVTLDFLQPAYGGTVNVEVSDDSPAINQELQISGGGFYRVTAKPFVGTLTLQNLYTTNAAPGTTIGAGSEIFHIVSVAMGLVGGSTTGIGISDSGKAVYYSLFTPSEYHSYIYTPGGGVVDMGVPEALASVQASGMNNLDDVCGGMFLPSLGENHGFFYRAGIFNDIHPAGADYSDAIAISPEDAYVTGNFSLAAFPGANFGFLSYGGAAGTSLGTFFAGSDVFPQAVNSSGVVVGNAETSPGVFQAFKYAGGLTSLGSLGHLPISSNASDVNDTGWACGTSRSAGGAPVTTTAVVWKPDGTIIDLNTLLTAEDASHWFLYDAKFINDSNQVAGLGLLDGVLHSFIFQIPEGT